MKDEIKKILDRLENIDHKEYSCSFEFADTATFDEMARCFEERKKMANYITNLQEENERLRKPLIPSETTELISLLYKEHLSNKNKKKLEYYITRLYNYNEHLLKTAVEKDYKLVEIEDEIDKVKNADMTGGNLNTLINKIENILQGENKE